MLTQQPQNHRPNANRASSTMNFENSPRLISQPRKLDQ
jgi:hypothetical protein